MKCKDCKYCEISNFKFQGKSYSNACCLLSHRAIIKPNVEHNCKCFNIDLSEYDICYNCKYYGGGGDWGLFCLHKDMYYHLGEFRDEPCEYYKKAKKRED